MEYTIKKKQFKLGDNVHTLIIHFKNRDYCEIRNYEIRAVHLQFHDRLACVNRNLSFVASGGLVKLKLYNKKSHNYWNSSVVNQEEFQKDRVKYLEDRLINKDDIDSIELVNKLNWSSTVLGDISAVKEDGFILLRFHPCKHYGGAESEYASVELAPIQKENICKVCLDFENCDGIDVYSHEIVDMNLIYSKQLCDWGMISRSLEGGYIRIKFDKYNSGARDGVHLYEYDGKISTLNKRICGKKEEIHDICHLYLEMHGSGRYENMYEEAIDIQDMHEYSEDYDEEYFEDYDEDDEEYTYQNAVYIGGYATKQKDGSILIEFGSSCIDKVKEYVKKQKWEIEIKEKYE